MAETLATPWEVLLIRHARGYRRAKAQRNGVDCARHLRGVLRVLDVWDDVEDFLGPDPVVEETK